ncbi:PREDICTED: receptor protein kinase TMK1-like [Nelumbo nucifera]|uniref:non-specific serine/threonine protein kinase n=1 Tax=Nelumbo nucifera TaxID=4432 RepID=A0A1U8AK99_NELNU|nr:PREDICTED: receptor protein kinase TMK1-like [Nelumbo nucifera]XP_010262998.1 PREDICTED: receptor protein kinase TMK1-like [Nelumbo nucifera]
MEDQRKLVLTAFLCFLSVVSCLTDPSDLKILNDFREGLENPELLKWPSNGDDPCGPPLWPHVFCSGNRISQIQVQGLGLKGPLPQNFNELKMLSNLGLQRNFFNGKLPTFSGLSELQYAYLGNNQFDTIPSDFVNGLSSLQVLSLDNNPLNASTGWSIPTELQNSVQLTNLSLMGCNLVGPLPDFLGQMPSLTVLKLSYNNLTGKIPASFNQSQLQILWLNNQSGDKMTGPIDVIGNIPSLTQIWLHGNKFTGTIPESIGQLVSLTDLDLNGNQLVGLIPQSMASLQLRRLDLSNNMFMGPLPDLKLKNFSYGGNSFCQGIGLLCAPEVSALLDFLDSVEFPTNLASSWKGNDPCSEWLGLVCRSNKVYLINLSRFNLNGTLSPSLGKLDSLAEIRLAENHLTGPIPSNLTGLKSLRLLDIGGNNLEPPVPKFSDSVKVVIDGNPLFSRNQSVTPSLDNNSSSSGTSKHPPINTSSPTKGSETHSGTPDKEQPKTEGFKSLKLVVIVAPLACFAFLVLLVVPLSICYCKKRKHTFEAASSFVVHPRDPSDPENMVKIVVSNNTNGSLSTLTGSSSQSMHSSGIGEPHMFEAGNLIISVQVLRNVTKNFAPENELGRGGFGAVYKGELDDGTKIAVKRMEAGVISNKALDEFHAEIAVLSKVRHRHLVSLLGYSIEGNERLLVYEYMPQGDLSKHLFHWKSLKLEPLSWKRRLNIALDVARGMEYLHTLAHQCFIHRDLKSSNILLGDDFRAKVSDFGLVKLAPDGEKSVVTRLAGTFGYLAPEYAVTGKITTKADVFSFGVVLMELLTGLMALDEERPEESQYLAAWFLHIKSSREKLMAAIDPTLEVNEETFESISIIAELAGHCTAREPNQRPDMGHAVNVLAPLVEKWKPLYDETEEYLGIDYSLPLNQMVKGWQEAEGKGCSYTGLDDSKGSIPARPTGFAESFTSADGR